MIVSQATLLTNTNKQSGTQTKSKHAKSAKINTLQTLTIKPTKSKQPEVIQYNPETPSYTYQTHNKTPPKSQSIQYHPKSKTTQAINQINSKTVIK